jgi:hypothetical protein
MEKTYTYRITLDEIEEQRAREVLGHAGMTVEGAISLLLSRTAREGELPLRRARGTHRRKPAAGIEGLFVQGDLFAEGPAAPSPLSGRTPGLRPSLITIASLQDAQAMLRWRERERSAEAGELLADAAGKPLDLLETKQFRLDKALIVSSPQRAAIIAALDAVFTELTAGRTPAEAQPLEGGESEYLPLRVQGLETGSLGLIYQKGTAEICLVRYGEPSSLLAAQPADD